MSIGLLTTSMLGFFLSVLLPSEIHIDVIVIERKRESNRDSQSEIPKRKKYVLFSFSNSRFTNMNPLCGCHCQRDLSFHPYQKQMKMIENNEIILLPFFFPEEPVIKIVRIHVIGVKVSLKAARAIWSFRSGND